MKRLKAKKTTARQAGADEIRPEYDFSRARPNKYASRYAKSSIVVTLDCARRHRGVSKASPTHGAR